jgi:hypothetical protein
MGRGEPVASQADEEATENLVAPLRRQITTEIHHDEDPVGEGLSGRAIS